MTLYFSCNAFLQLILLYNIKTFLNRFRAICESVFCRF
ncbi:hypothetical protein HPHPP26_0628 [Helicobacter pylori Hp P-26]|nr:hypothetical protein HPHPA20_0759 [Helicobacter pylori Hp A-20]EJB57429.1 hypothetical protein HPHPH30_0713 [Helicobacter pylori Hp H-30]EJC53361.1 hypothetical protein HPHPP26_0628 [Helicobacter pylori Hp P-26]